MEKLSPWQRELLENAVSRYKKQLPGSAGEAYLAERGLAQFKDLDKFCFGFVEDPLPGHERFQGKLAIPYLRRHPRHGWTCVSLRYRSLNGDKPKYLTEHGDTPRVFNTVALQEPVTEVGITEGELDAATATLCGLPTVGVPGATVWKDHWAEMFRGYKTVWIITDGDDPGEKMGKKLQRLLPNSRVIPLPDGEDTNSILTSLGPDAVRELWKGK